MAAATILLWAALPGPAASLAAPAVLLLLMPLAVAGATWFYTQRAVRTSMDLAVEAVEKLADDDLSTPATMPVTAETAGLAVAIERSRMALHQRQRAAKVHAAVARVMGLAIGRIAARDFAARITVELPAPYASFRNDFNGAMEALRAPGQESAARLHDAADGIARAADRLRRRAAKLAGRIEAELPAAQKELDGAAEALRAACHTLGGAGVAANRNIEAADRFAALARLIAAEADRLTGAEREDRQEEPAGPPALRLAGNG